VTVTTPGEVVAPNDVTWVGEVPETVTVDGESVPPLEGKLKLEMLWETVTVVNELDVASVVVKVEIPEVVTVMGKLDPSTVDVKMGRLEEVVAVGTLDPTTVVVKIGTLEVVMTVTKPLVEARGLLVPPKMPVVCDLKMRQLKAWGDDGIKPLTLQGKRSFQESSLFESC
jgi:hypothetical protein